MWSAFFITLFVPIQMHIGESASFWHGNFDAFQTLFWPLSFCFLALSCAITGILIFLQKPSFPLDIPKGVTASWIGVLLWGSIVMWQHGVSFAALSFLSSWLLLGIVCVACAKKCIPFEHVCHLLGWMALVQTGLALLQTLPGMLNPTDFAVGMPVLRSEHGEILRASGTLAHPNILGFFLVFMFFFTEILGSSWRKWRYVFVLGILCTFSRSALLALFAGSFMIFYTNSAGRKKRSSFTNLASIAVLCGIGIFMRRTFDTLSVSNAERISELQIAFEIFLAHPLWGVGTGNFTAHMATFDTFFPWQLQPVHNIFLLVGSEMGILGLILFISMFFMTGKRIFYFKKSYFKNAALGIFVAIGVFSVFEHLLLTSLVGIALLGIFGAMIFKSSD